MGAKGNPYGIRCVVHGGSTHEVRAGYLRQVKALHPDGRVDDPISTERLKVVNDGFQELKLFSRGRALGGFSRGRALGFSRGPALVGEAERRTSTRRARVVG